MNDDSDRDTQEQHSPPSAGSDAPGTPSDQPQEPAKDERTPNKKKRDYSKAAVFGFPLLEFLQLAFDCILVIVGIAGAYIVYRQLVITEKQLADAANDDLRNQITTRVMLRTAQEQAKAAGDAAKAMAQSVVENRKVADTNKTIADAAKRSADSSARMAEANTRQLAITESQAVALRSQAESVKSEAESMRGLAEANKVIAEAANRNASTNASLATSAALTASTQQRGTELEHRAWVWFTGIEVMQDGKPTASPAVGKWTDLRFTLVNTGRTPAADVQLGIVEAQHGETEYIGADTDYRSVAARETITVTVTIGALEDNISTSNIFKPLRVTTVLAYKDVFGAARKTSGCYDGHMTAYRGPRQLWTLGVTFTTCGEHNMVRDDRRVGARPPDD